MKNAVWSGIAFLTVCIAASGQAQSPQPGPDAKKLAMFVGNWQYEGTAKASPLGPAAKISGRQTGRLAGNGFAIELSSEETGVFGGVKWGETDVYDSASKSNRYLGYQDDGSIWYGSSSFSGNTLSFSGTQTERSRRVQGAPHRQLAATNFAPQSGCEQLRRNMRVSVRGSSC